MCPTAFQNHSPGNLNYEVLAERSNRIQHYWSDATRSWQAGQAFGDHASSPVAFQNHAPGNYNYEVIVNEGNGLARLRHYWYGHLADGQWHKAASFAQNSEVGAVFQNRAPNNYNYEVLAAGGGSLKHFWYNHLGDGQWHTGQTFGQDSHGLPMMFQNQSPNNYNYEVFVPENDYIQHYWYGHLGDGQWHKGQSFGKFPSGYIATYGAAFQNHSPDNYNYEIIVCMVPGAYLDRESRSPSSHASQASAVGYLQHYWYGHLGDGQWHEAQKFGEVAYPGSALAAFQESTPGNYQYEVIAGEGGRIRRYWYGHLADGQWHRGELFG